jgi:hypothetical protein
MSQSSHLQPEILFGYEHQLLSAEELIEVQNHIASCADCRLTLAQRMDLGGMIDGTRSALHASKPRAFSFLHYASAAAAILIVSALAIWLARMRPAARVSGEPASVKEALRTGHIDLPAFLKDLAPTKQVLMGEAPDAGTKLLSPQGTALLGQRPRFNWQTSEGEWTYQVRIFTLGGEPVASSPEIRGASWTSDLDLARGADYQWQLTATKGAERVTLPPPSETPPKFRVIDADTWRRLRDLADQRPAAHLELGVEYAKTGLLDDARRELTEASQLEPSRREILALLQSLNSR